MGCIQKMFKNKSIQLPLIFTNVSTTDPKYILTAETIQELIGKIMKLTLITNQK